VNGGKKQKGDLNIYGEPFGSLDTCGLANLLLYDCPKALNREVLNYQLSDV